MPGIFGFASNSPVFDAAARLEAMSAPMWHHTWYQSCLHEDDDGCFAVGQVTIGRENFAPKLATNESGNLLAVMEGEIYDYDEQRLVLETAGHRFATNSHAELLLHGFEQLGQSFVRSLHGKFAAAIWDSGSQTVHLINDRYGMKPLYFAQASGQFVFGSEIKSLLADPGVSRQSSLRGIAQFLTFGQLLAEDTLFDAVKLLPAAGWLTFDVGTGKVKVEQYWRLDVQVANERSQAEALDRIDSAFTSSVSRMTRDSNGLGLSLSGGLDARTILGVIGTGKVQATLSLGMAGSMDHHSAEEMARLVNCHHERVILGEEFLNEFETHLRRMVRLTDGQYLCQCIVMPTLPIYRELGVYTLLRGHVGELMHMTKAYNFSLNQRALGLQNDEQLFEWLWQRLQSFILDGTDGKIFAQAHREEMEGLARESLRDCLNRTQETKPTSHRIWQMFFEQRTRRETALSLVEFDSVMQTRLPYLDNELVDELFAAPPEMKLSDTIQSHILRRHRPDFLNVINVNTGTRVGASRFAKYFAGTKRRVLAKLGLPGYQPYERLGLWLRRELRPLVTKLLLNDRFLNRGVFDAQAVRMAVNDHLDNRRNHTYLLLALMIFEVGQQEFVDRQSAAVRPRSPMKVK